MTSTGKEITHAKYVCSKICGGEIDNCTLYMRIAEQQYDLHHTVRARLQSKKKLVLIIKKKNREKDNEDGRNKHRDLKVSQRVWWKTAEDSYFKN